MSTLRPTTIDDVIGQETIVDRLRITVGSSKSRGDAMPHMLFNGPPGLGKTTFASAVSVSRGVDIQIANAGNIRSLKNLTPYLLRLKKNSVLFIDEIHRLPMVVEEFLYPCMEDFRMDVGGEQTISMKLPEFTMIGATTLGGALSRPLYDRFTYHFDLNLYEPGEIKTILKTNAPKVGLTFDTLALESLASRCRGTPRHANNYLTWLRDYVQAANKSHVTTEVIEDAMRMIGVDERGITEQDYKYLETLSHYGKPMGLATLVGITGFDRDTIEHTIEPYLLRLKMIEKTPRGRICCGTN